MKRLPRNVKDGLAGIGRFGTFVRAWVSLVDSIICILTFGLYNNWLISVYARWRIDRRIERYTVEAHESENGRNTN